MKNKMKYSTYNKAYSDLVIMYSLKSFTRKGSATEGLKN
jgi:hypothetical protein